MDSRLVPAAEETLRREYRMAGPGEMMTERNPTDTQNVTNNPESIAKGSVLRLTGYPPILFS